MSGDVTLSPFEGLDVIEAGVEIPGAAGGLREAMAVDPQEMHKGERVHVVLECEVTKVRFDPVAKDYPSGDQRRVHILAVEGATIVEGDAAELVQERLDAQRERIQLAKEAEQGIQRIDLDSLDDLEAEHDAGKHADGLVDECPSCEEERSLAAAEAEGEGR